MKYIFRHNVVQGLHSCSSWGFRIWMLRVLHDGMTPIYLGYVYRMSRNCHTMLLIDGKTYYVLDPSKISFQVTKSKNRLTPFLSFASTSRHGWSIRKSAKAYPLTRPHFPILPLTRIGKLNHHRLNMQMTAYSTLRVKMILLLFPHCQLL